MMRNPEDDGRGPGAGREPEPIPPEEILPPEVPPSEQPISPEEQGPVGPRLARKLVEATGAGGFGFQRPGTPGATPWRTPEFYRGRSTAPDQVTPLGAGSPFATGGVGERDDEARTLRGARLLRRF